MAGTWADLTNQPTFNASTMLLLTDGTVMCQDEGTVSWWRLTPDSNGSYVHGTWSALANMHNSRLYYASAVLRDGRVVVAGGEDSDAGSDTDKAEIYDPIDNTWTSIGNPGWGQLGDASACLLADGRLLVGNLIDSRTAIYDPAANAWTATGNMAARSNEETWTLLPDGSVVTVSCANHPNAERYIPSAGSWISAGSTPVELVQASSIEIGPALLLPDGRVFAVGATGMTAIYTPPGNSTGTGSWAAGPSFPADTMGRLLKAKDAPGCLLPNGRVLCVAGPAGDGANDYPNPTMFFEFNGVNLNRVTDPPNANTFGFTGRMLLLPTSEVLYAAGTPAMYAYQPDPGGLAAWKPTVTACPTDLHPGVSYTLSGTQLNGLSQAVSYGDDAQMATNYPLVRLRNPATGSIIYCRTFDHSTMGVATGAATVSTTFTVPASVPPASYDLVVAANGIASDPVPVTIAAQASLGGIIELRLAQGGTWQQNNLTAFTGAPGALFAYVGPDGLARVVYTGSNGDIIELRLDPGGWVQADLTISVNNPPAPPAAGAPFAYVGPDGLARVVYTGSNGDIIELRLDPGGWVQADLTISVNNPPAPPAAGAPFAYVGPDGLARVVYTGSNGDIIELRLDPGGWVQADLTISVNNPPAPPAAGAPFAYVGPDGLARVVYTGSNGDIIELRLDPGGWVQADLTISVNNPPAPPAAGAPFAYVGPDGLARVVYTGSNGDIIELRLDPGGWVQADLTISVNNPPAPPAAGAPFAYVGPDGLARVVYTGSNGDIIELRLDPGGWVQADLTISVNNPPAPPAAGAPFAYVTPDKAARVYYSSLP